MMARLFRAEHWWPYIFFLAAVGSSIAGIALYIAVFLKSGHLTFLDWKLTQFHASYLEFGFIKRGIVGTPFLLIFEGLNLDKTEKIIAVVLFDSILYLIFLVVVGRALFFKEIERIWVAIFAALLIFSPLGLSQWSFDTGRLDHLNFILLALCASALLREKYFLSGSLAAFGVLVHEAFAIYAVPSLIFIEIARARARKNHTGVMKLSILIGPAFVAFASVVIWGNIENPTDLQKLATFYNGSSVWDRGFMEPALSLSFLSYLTIVIYIALTYILFFRLAIANGGAWATALIFVTPLVLFVAGIDYARWLHIIFISLILVMIAMPKQSIMPTRLEKICCIILCIPLGPIGITTVLPYLSYLGRML